jgi:2-oxoglutarate ferredoxin oxidoreductase subunit alpha
MPTRTQQADLLECAYASHGDTKHLLLFPANPAECFDFAVKSFDLAERFQTPVMMLSDLDIGMNDWVVPRLTWDDSYQPDRGRVLSSEDLERIARFYRYSDENEDSVAPRTLPGINAKGAYFTRGSGHNKFGGYTEIPEEYRQVVDRLAAKHSAAASAIPTPEIHGPGSSRIGIVAIGNSDPAVREAIDLLAQTGIEIDYMRIRGFPFHKDVEEFLCEHELTFVVDQNRDAQLRSLLTIETGVPKDRLRSVLSYGGFPLSAEPVVNAIVEQLSGADVLAHEAQ